MSSQAKESRAHHLAIGVLTVPAGGVNKFLWQEASESPHRPARNALQIPSETAVCVDVKWIRECVWACHGHWCIDRQIYAPGIVQVDRAVISDFRCVRTEDPGGERSMLTAGDD